jgi:predicted O-methyltransferase YrrM
MFNEKEFEIVKERALENHVPIIMDDTLEVVKNILEKEKPTRILEIGTAVGYSASCFVKYAPEVIVDTIELDEVRANEAIENVKKIGVDKNINIMIGNAVEILPTLTGEYDLVFIDAAKSKYSIFLSEGIRLIRNGGIILADNVLYKGYVMSDYNKHKQRTAVRHLREYIKEVTENPNLETEILEIGDGLAITRVSK